MKKNTLLTIGLATLLASAALGNQEKLAASIKETRAEAARTSEQLKATLAAINVLTKQTKGDLRPAYNMFVSEVSKTKTAAETTRTRLAWMQNTGQQYFTSWQKEVDGIANQSLRKKAQKRLDSVQSSYGKAVTALTTSSEKFAPFLSDLTDIQKTLANDVTPSGVKAMRSTVRSANWNHGYVNGAINNALKEMDKMEKSLSPEVK